MTNISAQKRPAFQFYPADWRKDTALQSCSLVARGLWHELMCLMHECEPYGHLAVNSKAMKPDQVARLVGISSREYLKLLGELMDAGVPSVNKEGLIYSRRMVRDEHIRNVRAQAGKKGGNPNLVGKKVKHLVKQKDNQDSKQTDKQSLTPSSSSSSSYSVPNGTGGEPPDPAEVIFGRGVPLLTAASVSERNARSMLGLLRKTHGDEDVIAALQACVDAKALEPVAYLQGVLRAAKKADNRPRMTRADERAQWMASFWQPRQKPEIDMGVIDADS